MTLDTNRKIDVGSGTLLPESVGSAKELVLYGNPKFEASTIAGVESLVISDLNKNMFFPPTLKRLIIRNYTGTVPLPKVGMVAVHCCDSRYIKDRVEHYIMHFGESPVPKRVNEMFECVGDRQVITVCGDVFNILKREPRVQADPGCTIEVPVPPATTPELSQNEPMSKVLETLAAQRLLLEAMIQQ